MPSLLIVLQKHCALAGVLLKKCSGTLSILSRSISWCPVVQKLHHAGDKVYVDPECTLTTFYSFAWLCSAGWKRSQTLYVPFVPVTTTNNTNLDMTWDSRTQSMHAHRVSFEQLGSPLVIPLFRLIVASFWTHLPARFSNENSPPYYASTKLSTHLALILASRLWLRLDTILSSRIVLCLIQRIRFHLIPSSWSIRDNHTSHQRLPLQLLCHQQQWICWTFIADKEARGS
jgi:hypothetical protein